MGRLVRQKDKKENEEMAQKSTAAAQGTTVHRSVVARDIMQRPVVAATALASLRDVATQLVKNGFSGMPVADPDGRVVGVVTESDIVRTLIAGKRLENLTAGEVMTGPPITVEVETPIEDVMKQLEENRIVRVPVIDHDKLVGIISRGDIIRAILEPEFIAFGD
jgi:CBS domain-containing protein